MPTAGRAEHPAARGGGRLSGDKSRLMRSYEVVWVWWLGVQGDRAIGGVQGGTSDKRVAITRAHLLDFGGSRALMELKIEHGSQCGVGGGW